MNECISGKKKKKSGMKGFGQELICLLNIVDKINTYSGCQKERYKDN